MKPQMTKHERDVLSKYIHDEEFTVNDAGRAMDMNSRSGAINALKNLAVEVLVELKWKV